MGRPTDFETSVARGRTIGDMDGDYSPRRVLPMRPLGPGLFGHRRFWWASPKDPFERPGLYVFVGEENHRIVPVRGSGTPSTPTLPRSPRRKPSTSDPKARRSRGPSSRFVPDATIRGFRWHLGRAWQDHLEEGAVVKTEVVMKIEELREFPDGTRWVASVLAVKRPRG